MHLTRLGARDFRNYERAQLELGDGLTVVCGPNGAGKTNLLEGLYFGLTGRSCRTSNEREMVRAGQRVARAEVATEGEDGPHLLEVGFEPGEPKRLRVDGAAADNAPGAAVRPLAAVFLPERLGLVEGAPAGRPAHPDQLVGAVLPPRPATARALPRRNAQIAGGRAGAATPALLDPWDSELARHGAQLMADRSAV